jgi:hypothetical protein
VCAALKFVRIRSDATGVLSFEPTDPLGVGFLGYRDAILRSSERAVNDTMMICCSVAKTER